MTQRRQPRGIPVGGEFAANDHDEAMSALQAERDAESVTGIREPRVISDVARERAIDNGKTAGGVAAGYYQSALRQPLTVGNWDYIESDLKMVAHHLSSESNTWQPVLAETNGDTIDAARSEYLKLTTGAKSPALAAVSRSARGIARGLVASVDAALDIPEELRRDTKESLRTLSAPDRAIADARMLLGMRRSVRAVPRALSFLAEKTTGKTGKAVRKALAAVTNSGETRRVLERSATRDDEKGRRAQRMLRMLDIADKPSSVLIDEIAAAKKGEVSESDIRDHLSHRSHLELSRFRYDLDGTARP